MSMTDTIADMLTRIRNAVRIGKPAVEMPSSKAKIAVAQVLEREGYVEGFEIVEQPVQNRLLIRLKYGPLGEQVINRIRRVSRPGRRVYAGATELRPVLRGLGIYVVSTPKGMLSDREARSEGVGGEILAEVY